MQPTPTPSLPTEVVRRFRIFSTPFHAGIFITLLALGACRDPKVAVHRVAKDQQPPASQPAHQEAAVKPAMPAMPTPGQPAAGAPSGDSHGLQTASGPGLTWTAPASWQPKQGSMMRKATFAIVGEGGAAADLAVTAFPGDVGGDVANVNRWRGQLGLKEVSDADALKAIERIEANGLKIGLVDLVDASTPNGAHLLGAIVPFEGATWFFKLVGPDAVVAKAKPEFVAFVKTIKPAVAKP